MDIIYSRKNKYNVPLVARLLNRQKTIMKKSGGRNNTPAKYINYSRMGNREKFKMGWIFSITRLYTQQHQSYVYEQGQ